MTNEQFAALVRRAEDHARRSPGLYRLRVGLLGALGYLYVWLLFLLGLGISALMLLAIASGTGVALFAKLLLPALAFAWVVLRALWVRFEAPGGIPLPPENFPELHETLARIRTQVKGPRLHQVLLDDRFNASITQVPRLGVLGWHRNYLVLGLPLLLALPREEVEAVLAHEYGHLSGAHGKFGSWIYRIRITWMRLMAAFQEGSGAGTALVQKFFDWYAPYFHGYSFALARANEYEADRAAAQVAGPEIAGSALVRISILAPWLDSEYWPGLYAGADDSPEPLGDPFRGLASPGFAPDGPRAGEILEGALKEETGVADTHPALRDRLAALGVSPECSPSEGPSAAHLFLGWRMDQLVARCDQNWRDAARPWFQDRNARVEAGRSRLAQLESGGAQERDALLEKARILDELHGREVALPVYRRILEVDPDHGLAACIVGLQHLTEGDEEQGVALLERGMEQNPTLVGNAAQILRDHFAAQGEMARADDYHDRLQQWLQGEEVAHRERQAIPFREVYDPHDLPGELVQRAVDAVRADRRVKGAFLVRKRLTRSEEPMYLLALLPAFRFSLVDRSRLISQEMLEAVDLPVDHQVLVLKRDHAKLRKILKKVPGARIV